MKKGNTSAKKADIPRRKRAEKVLSISKDKLSAVFEFMAEAAVIADLEGRIIDANPAAIKLYGYDNKQELTSTKDSDLVAETDRDRAIKDRIYTLKTGESRKSEYRLVAKGGGLFDGELNMAVMRDHSGNPFGLIEISRDISDRKRMEEKFREGELKLQTFFGSLTDGLIVTDMMGTIIDANEAAARIGKYKSAEDLIRRNGVDFVTHADRNRVAEALLSVTSDPERTHSEVIEYIAQDKDGNPFYGEASAGIIRENSGRPVRMVFITRDITERKKAEEALRRSEEKFRQLADGLLDVIWIMDTDLRYTYISPSVTNLRGYSVEEAINQSLAESMTPDSLETAMRIIAEDKSLRTKEQQDQNLSVTLELELTCKDGSTVWTENKMTYMRDHHGRVTGYLGVTRDVSERKKIEEELRRSEAKYRTLTETTNDIVYSIDNMGNLTFIGPQISRYDLDPEKMIGGNFLGFVHPDDREKLVLDVERTLTTNEEFPSEFRVLNAAGNTYWLEEVGKVQRDSSGTATGITGALRDITERKRAEQELRRSEERFKALVENAFEGVFIISKEGFPIYHSPKVQNQTGLTANAITGTNFLEVMHPDDINKAAQNMKQIVNEHGTRVLATYRVKYPDGSYHYIETSSINLIDNPSIGGIVVNYHDVTERKRAEETLEKYKDHLEELVNERTKELNQARIVAESANKAKSDFLANMSHEIRTPLNSIIGFSETLYDEIEGPLNDEQKKHLGIITSSGHHLLSLINDILDLSKVEAGKMELTPTIFSMNDILKNSLSFFKEKAAKHNLRLSTDISADVDEIEADERKVKQIINNLLSNAVKFTPDGGSITLRADIVSLNSEALPVKIRMGLHDMKYVLVSVKDTGIGIAEKDREKLFKEFSQIEEAYTKKHEGTGLGLSLSKKMVEMHGGKIWFESEGEGKGSTFYFVLPTKVLPKG